MTAISNRPAKPSAVLALAVGTVAVGLSTPTPFLPFVVTAGGFGLVTIGLLRASRGLLAAGVLGMIVGFVFAGIADGSEPLAVVGATATMVTWDFAERSIELGEQLGRDAGTIRNEAAHVGMTTIVAVGAVGTALMVTVVRVGSLPLPALVTAMVAALVLVIALRT